MTRSKTYRFVALSLAFLVFFSSAGITLDAHFCQDELKGISVFSKASNCHEKKMSCSSKSMKSCCASKKKIVKEDKPCCHNESTVLLMDSDLVLSQFLDINTCDLDLCILRSEVDFSFTPLSRKNTRFQNYRPPPLIVERHIVFQNFRC